ncbi:MAG TPA: hypothetical protein ENJ80_16020 [Gammaproteobacteria bacterium]|nr:hypothetical protein [Gammaproteobacteria bacterium]
METEPVDFRTAFRGTFSGILRWEQLDAFWDCLRNDAAGNWYLYAVGEEPPTETVSEAEVVRFIDEVDELLRREHAEDYCGVVYVDDVSVPGFVKIFDPNNLGVSCGYSDNPPLPGWILSKLQPVDLQAPMPQPGNRRRWWQRLFAS